MSAVDLPSYCLDLARRARAASRTLAAAGTAAKDSWLAHAAQALEHRTPELLAANARDVAAAGEHGLNAAAVDRLRLTPARLAGVAAALREVVALPDPVGQVREVRLRPNGLEVRKVGVPLGVILFIYESRPNVTADAAALCVKSGNALILRGGREASRSNLALVALLQDSLRACALPPDAVQYVAPTDREGDGRRFCGRIPGPDCVDQGGSGPRRGGRLDCALRFRPHRGDRDAEPGCGPAVYIVGGLRGGAGQRQHALQRRR